MHMMLCLSLSLEMAFIEKENHIGEQYCFGESQQCFRPCLSVSQMALCALVKRSAQHWEQVAIWDADTLSSFPLLADAWTLTGRQDVDCESGEHAIPWLLFFLFHPPDVGRAVHAPAHITEKVVELFRSKSEFTFLASIQQKTSTSGVIFSIHESEHR